MQDQNIHFMRRVVNQFVTFNHLLAYIEKDFPQEPRRCFCPFHDNTKTESAVLYKNDDGESLFCFSESRLYRPSDLLERDIVPFTLQHAFNSVWMMLNEQEKSMFGGDSNRVRLYTKDYIGDEIFNKFKKGEKTMKDLYEVLKALSIQGEGNVG